MGDPVSERSHYLAVKGDGTGDLFLIQGGRVEHLGLLGVGRTAASSARAARLPFRGVGLAIACVLVLILAVAA